MGVMQKGLLIFLISIVPLLVPSYSFSQAAKLSDASYLRKLSLHLRGLPPEPIEYLQLQSAQGTAARAKFFADKIALYTSTTNYQTKMTVRLEELFKLRTTDKEIGMAGPPNPSGIDSNFLANALDDLFIHITHDNQSWDNLLTAKAYRLYDSQENRYGHNDFGFFLAVLPKIVPDPNATPRQPGPIVAVQPIDVSFDANDARVAGALTTARFFDRYTTTELNKNRRRAAAVFNIFLCDSMAAAIPDPPASPDDDLDRAFPKVTFTEPEIAAVTKGPDKHGADQACVKCHYKLDPMGQTFMSSTATLSPQASPGRLTFRDMKTGVLVNQPVSGIGELASAITQQDQYLRCQIRHFWNWFIGSDRDLSDARERQLIGEFNRVGRKTNDFVQVLVTAPEFRERDFRTEAQVRADSVRSIMKNCADCHSAKIPDFTVWPIGGTSVTMKDWTDRISKRLDLPNGGAARDMPPNYSAWQPTLGDLAFLKAWINDGAPNEKGDRQL